MLLEQLDGFLIREHLSPKLFCMELVILIPTLIERKLVDFPTLVWFSYTLVWFSDITINKVLALINAPFPDSKNSIYLILTSSLYLPPYFSHIYHHSLSYLDLSYKVTHNCTFFLCCPKLSHEDILKNVFILTWEHFFSLLLEREERRENINMREKHQLIVFRICPDQGPNPQWGPNLHQGPNPEPSYVPWPRMEPTTLWWQDDTPTNWATPARASHEHILSMFSW